jgi:hypothetical protein
VCAKGCWRDKGEFGASRKFRPFQGLFAGGESWNPVIGGQFCLAPPVFHLHGRMEDQCPGGAAMAIAHERSVEDPLPDSQRMISMV